MQALPVLPNLCCGPDTPPLAPQEREALAARFKALADPARVAIVNRLAAADEVCVCDLNAVGIDVSGRTPRALDREDVEWADLVVTMGCGDACPVLPGKEYLEWNLPDAAGLCLEEVRELRAVIEDRVSSLPI